MIKYQTHYYFFIFFKPGVYITHNETQPQSDISDIQQS